MKTGDKTAMLEDLLGQRILLLDGAMGTMIQAHELDEAAYRGRRFADWPSDVKGNNDLLKVDVSMPKGAEIPEATWVSEVGVTTENAN